MRRRRSKLERRRIVEESLIPGATVAEIARHHRVNANQVHGWRKLYRQGRLDAAPPETTLVPSGCSTRHRSRPLAAGYLAA